MKFMSLTLREVNDRIAEKCSGFSEFNKEIKINNLDTVVELFDEQIDALINLIVFFNQSGKSDFARELFKDIEKNPTPTNGKVYEALVYSWLYEKYISFTPQTNINAEMCLKKHSYYADGRIDNVIFDVKQFGIAIPHIRTLRDKVQEKMPDYIISIGGTQNISSKDIEQKALAHIDNIVEKLKSDETKTHTTHIYRLKDLDMEIRAIPKSERIAISISEFNAYEWAEKNETYFLRHGSQFCTLDPYIIFCPFDQRSEFSFSNEDVSKVQLLLRPLCRRMFIHLNHIENRMLHEYDGKAKTTISVASASRKISAIVFLDVTKQYDYNNCRAWVFVNPNADNKLYEHQINSWFRFAGAMIEDFRYDNY